MKRHFYKSFCLLFLLTGLSAKAQTVIDFTTTSPTYNDYDYLGSSNLDVDFGGKTLRFNYNNASESGSGGGPNYYLAPDGSGDNENRGLLINEKNAADKLTISFTDNAPFSFNSFKTIDFNIFYDIKWGEGFGGPAHQLTITGFDDATQVASFTFTYTYTEDDFYRNTVNTLAADAAFGNVTKIEITANDGLIHMFDDVGVQLATANAAPTVTTTTASSITATSATLGGNVTADGGATVTQRGIVYNTTGTPTTADTKVQIGDGTGVFSDEITGLTAETEYFVRAYAVNSEGTAYGDEVNFTTDAAPPIGETPLNLIFTAKYDEANAFQGIYGYNTTKGEPAVAVDINPYGSDGIAGLSHYFDHKLFGVFLASNGARSFGYYDGTDVVLVDGLGDGLTDAAVEAFAEYDDELYFILNDGSGSKYHLWRYNTLSQSLTKISASLQRTGAGALAEYNGKLYFAGTTTSENRMDLYSWDGSTVQLVPNFADVASQPGRFAVYNGYLYMIAAPSGEQSNQELYRYSDADGGSTELVVDLNTHPTNNLSSSGIGNFTLYGGKLFFPAIYNYDTKDGLLYSINTSNVVTEEYNPPFTGGNAPSNLIVIDNTLYFTSPVNSNGDFELMRYNATGDVTQLSNFSTPSISIGGLAAYDGDIYFFRDNGGGKGKELQRYSIDSQTFTELSDINPLGDSFETGSALTALPLNIAPVVYRVASGQSYATDGPALSIAPELMVSDVEQTSFIGATVSIASGFAAGDELHFTDQSGISGSYNGASGVLTLSGTATLANYQNALRSITFSSGSTEAGDRVIRFRVDNGARQSSLVSPSASATIRVAETVAAVDFETKPDGLAALSGAPTTLAGAFSVTAAGLGQLNFVSTANTLATPFDNLEPTAGDNGMVWNDGELGGINSLSVISADYENPKYLAFRSADGNAFDFDGFTYWDDGTLNGYVYYGNVAVYGFLDGDQVATAIYPVQMEFPAPVLLDETFNEVDEVRIRVYDPYDPEFVLTAGLFDNFMFVSSNTPPVASAVTVTGELQVGATLEGKYDFEDADEDEEGASTYQWYRYDAASGDDGKAAIEEATEKTYTLQAADEGKYISFEVTPHDGTSAGTPVESGRQGPIVGNTPPVMDFLDGDNVAWGGVDNTVVLDQSGDAVLSDADFEALNDGNGDWAGGTLTVQRAGTAITTDIFDLDTEGGSFTVSGADLQSDGHTFAAFTHTDGVLTISFTGSGTAATTDLVNDVARRITYRNDTPAGDAAIRFTLSDGEDDATADVTVASDIIYITNTADASTIDISDGVGFREAVAIAAADNTGNQILVLAGTLDNGTVNLETPLAINEKLTIQQDDDTVSITGSEITLGTGVKLNFDNPGDISIGNDFSGPGDLVAYGGGKVTLSGVNSAEGTTRVWGGSTLSITSDANLTSGTLTVDAGTLEITGGSTNIDNGISFSGVATFTNSGNVTLSGAITGASGATLNKAGSGTLTLSGTNSYPGPTTVSAGTLSVAGDDNLGAGTVSLGSGTTLTVGGAGTIDNAIALSGDATLSNASAVTLSGAISGTGGLSKAGAGTLTLSGTNTYTGSTAINAGTLLLTGSLQGTSAVTVAGGTTLSGDGSVFATGSANTLTVDNGGTLSPGNAVGILTVNGGVQLNSGSTLAVDINGTAAGTDYDHLVVSGDVTVSGASLVATHGYTPGDGDGYTIIDRGGSAAISGTFTDLAEGGTVTAAGNGTVLTASYTGGTGNDLTLEAPHFPKITSVTADKADGSYGAGAVIPIQVGFSGAVTVTGTPQLTLETGATDRTVNYTSGTGSTTLTFEYIVQDGDVSADLDYGDTHALTLNGGTIQDSYGNNAVLTLPAPGSTGSLGSNKALVIDTQAPDAPSAPDLATDSDSGESNTDNITNLADLTLQGAAGSVEANAVLHARSSLGGGLTGGTANADGSWSFDVLELTEGTHQLQINATDAAGNTSAYSDAVTVVIDVTAPSGHGVSFDAAAINATGAVSTGFTFSGAEVGAAYSYEITSSGGGTPVTGTGTIATATDPVSGIDVSGLPDGTLTLSVTVMDVAGNSASAVTDAAILDRVVPEVEGVESGEYYKNDVTPTFNEGTALLNDTPYVSGTPITAEGGYKLVVTDAAGNMTVVAFTIDKTVPEVEGVESGEYYKNDVTPTFNEGTALLNGTPYVSGTPITAEGGYKLVVTDAAGNMTVVAFTIDKTVPEVEGVESGEYYNEDVTPTFDEGTALLNGTPYVSGTPITAEGGYKLVVTDAAGNMTVMAFTIDKTVPEVEGVESGEYYKNEVTPTFNEGAALLNSTPYVSGTPITAEGGYKLVVTDAAGNMTVVAFTIDKTVPEVEGVESGEYYNEDVTPTFDEGTALLNGNPYVSGTPITAEGGYKLVVTDAAGNMTVVAFTIDKTVPEVEGVEDGRYYKENVSPVFNEGAAVLNGELFTSGTEIAAEGEYTLVVTDASGNADTVRFTIDKTLPEITGVDDGTSYNTDVTPVFNEGTATLNGEPYNSGGEISAENEYTLIVTDASGNADTVRFTIDKTLPEITGVEDGASYNGDVTVSFNEGTATLNGEPYNSGGEISAENEYTLIVTDAADNADTVNFTIDKTLPEITGVEDGASYNEDVTVTFDEGTATLNGEPYNSGGEISEEDEYTLIVTDAAGNADTVNFTIDKTVPEITGVEDGASYNGNVTVTFNEGTATLNGEPYISGEVINAEDEYTLIVTDAAGNADTVSFTIDKALPEIMGVEDGASYNGDVTVTFNEGTATLNGEPYTPGTSITKEGKYTLVVTDAGGNQTTVNFVIDRTAPVVTGVEEGGLYAGEAAASFNEGTAVLNDEPYTSGTPIRVAGEYTLTATDAAGNETVISFTVGVLPGAPTGLRAEAGNRQVMLEWEAPAGVIPAVTDYVIEYSRDGGSTWTVPDREPSAATRSLVIGLENNRTYAFRVSAVNGVGQGVPSGTVQAIPTEPVPDAEGNLPEQEPGIPVVVTDGKVEAVMLEVVDSEYLRLSGDGYAMELASVGPDGERIPISAIDAVIRLLKGNGTQVYVSGNGFEPGTVVTVYLFSVPELVGHLPVAADGSFGGSLPVPAGLELGQHTLQANGVVAGGGGERSVSIGLELVDRRPQWLEFGALDARTYGEGPVTLDGKSTSGLAVTYTVTDSEGKPTDIAVIENNNRLTIRGAGDIRITASQVGNADYSAASPVTQALHIAQAPLFVHTADATRAYGEENPVFEISYDGFVPGEDASSLDRAPSAATDATATSAPGSYAINISGGQSSNYAFTYDPATLTVVKAVQAITFTAPAEVDRSAGSIQLDVSAGSGLPVTLSIDDEQVAAVSGNTLNILRLGTVHITATQAGDGNYEAAEPVTVAILVTDRSSDFAVRVHPAVSPNGDGINEFLMIEAIKDHPDNRVTVISRNGTVLWEASGYDNDRVVFRGISTGQQQLPAGTYFHIVEVKVNGKWEHRKGYFVIRY